MTRVSSLASYDKPDDTTKTEATPSHGRNLPLKQFLIVYACLSIAVFLTSLDQTIVACLLPRQYLHIRVPPFSIDAFCIEIAPDFKSSKSISWVGTAFLLTSTSFSPICEHAISSFLIQLMLNFFLQVDA